MLKRLRRKTRGKGKRDRMEWALVSKKNPKKILKWFGPEKPSKKMIAKEERRIHAFSSINNINNIDEVTMKKELIMMANHLDESGYKREADFLDQLIKKAGDDVVGEELLNIDFEDEQSGNISFEDSKEFKMLERDAKLSRKELVEIMKLRLAQEEVGEDILDKISSEDGKKLVRLVAEKYSDLTDADIGEVFEEKFIMTEGPTAAINRRIYSLYSDAMETERQLEEDVMFGSFETPFPVREEIFAKNLNNDLVKLSNHLDSIGQHKEANILDKIIKSAKKERS